MPKKFVGTNSKAAEAKARKASAQHQKEAAKAAAAEDAAWADDDKLVNRKLGRKAEAERKKEEAAARKAANAAAYEEELAAVARPAQPPPAPKVTQAEMAAERERREAARREAEEEESRLQTFQPEENLNRLSFGEGSARDVDSALKVLAQDDGPVDKHPEKRMGSAWKAFEGERMPALRKENPGLKVSQLRQLLRKDWQRSPANPLNAQPASPH